jgi:hypothetical protein
MFPILPENAAIEESGCATQPSRQGAGSLRKLLSRRCPTKVGFYERSGDARTMPRLEVCLSARTDSVLT